MLDDDAPLAVDPRHRLAEAGGDPVRGVPGVVVGDDVGVFLLAREHGREHQPVVVAARLGVEERHLVGAGVGLEEMLQRTARGHAGADDDEFLGHEDRSDFPP